MRLGFGPSRSHHHQGGSTSSHFRSGSACTAGSSPRPPAPPRPPVRSASSRVGSAQVPALGLLRKFLHLFRFYPFNFRISNPLVSAERVFRVGPGLEPRGPSSQFILPSRADGLHGASGSRCAQNSHCAKIIGARTAEFPSKNRMERPPPSLRRLAHVSPHFSKPRRAASWSGTIHTARSW